MLETSSSNSNAVTHGDKKRRILAGDKPPLRDGDSPRSLTRRPPKLDGPPEGGTIEAIRRSFGYWREITPIGERLR